LNKKYFIIIGLIVVVSIVLLYFTMTSNSSCAEELVEILRNQNKVFNESDNGFSIEFEGITAEEFQEKSRNCINEN